LQRVAHREQRRSGRSGHIEVARRVHRQIVRLVHAFSAERGEQSDLARRVQLHDEDSAVTAARHVGVAGSIGQQPGHTIVIRVANVGGEIGGRQSSYKA
jgi:hypothetical protein